MMKTVANKTTNQLKKLKVLAAMAITSITLIGCGESSSSNAGPDFGTPTVTPTEFNEADLLANLADNVVTPAYTQFASISDQLTTDIDTYCQTETLFEAQNATAEQVTESLDIAQTSWRNTMNQWQQIELMQFTPLLNNDSQLRNRIYSWPVVSTCGVDLDVVSFERGNIAGAPFDIALRTPARKGLDAAEYLLFNTNLSHSCTGAIFPETWDSRTEQSRKIARCEYVKEIANDVNTNAQILLNEWSGTNGFAAVLKSAGSANNDFATEHEAVNHISDAMFYIDSVTKDGKLATPLAYLPTNVAQNLAQLRLNRLIRVTH